MNQHRFIRKLYRAENTVVIFLFILVFFILFLQFFTRYILNNSFGWTEEIARIILITLCFTGAIVNARDGSEIFLEVTQSRLSPRWAAKVDFLLIKPISTIIYFWLSGLMAVYFTKSRQYLSTVNVSKKYFIAIIAISFFLMGMHSIVRIKLSYKKHRNLKQ